MNEQRSTVHAVINSTASGLKTKLRDLLTSSHVAARIGPQTEFETPVWIEGPSVSVSRAKTALEEMLVYALPGVEVEWSEMGESKEILSRVIIEKSQKSWFSSSVTDSGMTFHML